MTDDVNHPAHYGGGDNPYEAIKVIEAWALGFHLGNAVKYISRAGKKGGEITDLRKAVWYLERRIEQLEGQSPPATKPAQFVQAGRITPLPFPDEVGEVKEVRE